MKLATPTEIAENLKHKHYGLSKHGAVQICLWTKKALRNEGVCYKEKFYDAHCHRCMEMTPLAVWCNQNCIFCWRPSEWLNLNDLKKELEKPEEMVEKLIEKRKKLLSGFGGSVKKYKTERLFKESLIPDHFAISLSGEPTLYKKLPGLIKLLKEKYKARTVFLVTNGSQPEMLLKLQKERALPIQLYISFESPNENDFLKTNKPRSKNAWKTLMRTFSILPKLDVRKVIRITLMKNINDSEEKIKQFSMIINESFADFVELKSYMHVGSSRERLKKENMLEHKEIKEISKKFLKYLKNFRYEDEQKESRIVLLKNKKSPYKTKFD
ncbi:tRNA-modifying enzyme [Candidatus Pacearchaeota archaeon CG1_02_31_27]|nr:MAG: tRNA-modifying enzyme [Candidatus Pacearchaeota archaeon CG1_02_31_27]PIN92128.1 MAG: 4-demethylwyosine synthase TYW1 [Candidatus Pacearchaeota archaeon CG10_big_fil_rev_8_21_14_0_10_31_59]PIZ80506.1 MAG: 4-demethylwyosine synthase TYW1 [Candidatus Pacearchaeota archaeon CG_4_10_14_0_2_um_filter_31_10]